MKNCPTHIEKFVVDASSRFRIPEDGYHFYFELKCVCGSQLFYLLFGDKRSVRAICNRCLNKITIYNLSFYPSASTIGGEEAYYISDLTCEVPALIFVMYEYGILDEGDDFDKNDITWCQVFVESPSGLTKVFDDETA